MFERYTEKARRVIFFARYEASQFGGDYIEPHHLLLGLMREDKHLIFQCLQHSDVEQIRARFEKLFPPHDRKSTSVDMPVSVAGNRVLRLAAEEADRLQHKYIDTGHLLLGIRREEKSAAAEALRDHGARAEAIEAKLAQAQTARPKPREESSTRPWSFLSTPLTERHTDRVRRALFFARFEASACFSGTIETEHLLLGVLHEDASLVTRFLGSSAILNDLVQEVREKYSVVEAGASPFDFPPSEESRTAIEESVEEADLLGHKRVGPKHLLLAMLRQEHSVAARLMASYGVRLEDARAVLGGDGGPAGEEHAGER